MKIVDKQVHNVYNFPFLTRNGVGCDVCLPKHVHQAPRGLKIVVATFLFAILGLAGARSVFAFTVLYDSGANQSTYNIGGSGSFSVGAPANINSGHFGTITQVTVYYLHNTGSVGTGHIYFTGITVACSSDSQTDNWNGAVTFTFSTPCVVDGHVSGSPNLAFSDDGTGGNFAVGINPTDGSGYYSPAFVAYSGSGVPPNTTTRIETTVPLNGATVSSTTPVTVGATVYVNPLDYSSGMYLNISFTNNTVSAIGGSALDAWNSAWGTGSTGGFASIQIPITATSTDLSLSTTTSNFVRDGNVTAKYSIQSPNFWSSLWFVGSLFSGSTIVSTTTQFTVGELTSYDIASAQSGTGIANTILFGTTTSGISSSTVEAITSACLPWTGQFNLFGCAQGLIVPSSDTLASVFSQARDGFLSYFPFGYVTRFYAIISGTATSSLPALSVTVPVGFPAAGDTLNLTPWGHLMGAGSYLATATSTATGHTFESTFEIYWDDFVYFVFGVGVVLRLVGMNSTLTFGFGGKKEQNAVQNKKTKR